MNWRQLFFGFNGRINRKPYWLGALTLILIGAAGVLGASFVTALSKEGTLPLPAEIGAGLLIAVVGLVLFGLLTLSVKRLHDRGRSGNWMAFYLGAAGALAALNVGLGGLLDGSQQIGPIDVGLGFNAVGMLIGLWYLIDLGFRKGEPGTNRYGANPLGGARADASL